jgi:hypothetical protein
LQYFRHVLEARHDNPRSSLIEKGKTRIGRVLRRMKNIVSIRRIIQFVILSTRFDEFAIFLPT